MFATKDFLDFFGISQNIATWLLSGIFSAIGSVIIFPKLRKRFLKYFIKENTSLPSLLKCDIFPHSKNILMKINNSFKLQNDPTKEAIFKELLLQYVIILMAGFYSTAKEIEELCLKKCNGCKLDVLKSLKIHNDNLDEAIHKFNNFHIYENYTNNEREMISYAIHKFNEWNEPNLEQLKKAIVSLHTDNVIFKNTCTKLITVSVFTVAQGYLELMQVNAAKAIEDINGYFLNKTFRNIIKINDKLN